MILNARQNGFMVLFPQTFFSPDIDKKYEKYYKSLLMPYRSISDFMSATIQSINMPGFMATLPEQTRILGKRQDLLTAKPIADLFVREFKLTFKLTDSYLNYWIFMDNALNFLSPNKVDREADIDSRLGRALSADPVRDDNHPYYDPIRLVLLNNEGYAVTSVIFNRPILKGVSELNLSYSSISPKFVTFTATFAYYDFDLEPDFD